MSSETSPISVEKQDGVATITLDRGEQRNPQSIAQLEALHAALDDIADDGAIRVVILTGAGKIFSAGAELGKIVHPDGLDGEWQLRTLRRFNQLTEKMRELEVPIVCALNGPAVGGGTALAMACDIVIAAPHAAYVFAFGRIGATGADLGAAFMLPKIVGAMRARHWLLTGATVGAEEGKAAGLFLDIVPVEGLMDRARAIAAQIVDSSPRRALAVTKMAINRGEDADFHSCVSYEAYAQSFLFTLDEHKTLLRGMLEGKKK